MVEYKRLKDPIYGYIKIPSDYMNGIIDSAVFQRLRHIIQTSYSPLYSSAVHNRFVHSLGVYYLGSMSGRVLQEEIKKEILRPTKVEKISQVYQLACLLHDVGHAPFSHTGEYFYLNEEKDYHAIHGILKETVGSKNFDKDVPNERSESAAPHEIVSAIIGIKEFVDFFTSSDDKEFFARCITGYIYSKDSVENQIRNCFISMLNSKVIDVDKLDYLIRDAYVTGFDTVNIDFERLLSALTIVEYQGKYELAYYKNAISIIENVVYAHDAERKWIQSHPVVLYESYLLQNIIFQLCQDIEVDDKKLFSLESLSKDGVEYRKGLTISLLSDEDIFFLMKNIYKNDLSEEFLERKRRRHPVWKSEAEYKTYILKTIGNSGVILRDFEKAMEDTTKYLLQRSNSWAINEDVINKLSEEISALDSQRTLGLDSFTKETQKANKQNILKIMKCLQEYATEKDFNCDFVVLTASQFKSGFGKADFSDINIVFKNNKKLKVVKFGDGISSIKAKEIRRSNFFYLFHKRGEKAEVIDAEDIGRRLYGSFV